ncbi:GNAT family N-acetyltransferase [Gimesia fumaroli]|uniref:TDP-fucosamine acetyltransferase n=1 Tax=Gimesia fumaroli TaxID=2527976 RepID=A0A518IC36_9PLAN|nr:GNAT family N-acetyltransferase [Gimesia fumaroli]QDV50661.1 TDP-fucosamine acetyltransferase [Gimesia fumaroli]
MNQITVRQATLADRDILAPLFDSYRQFYGRSSDLGAAREFLSARFNHGESVLFLAFDAETPVGFAQLYPSFSSVSLARTFILNDLFVSPDGRRKGVGTQLLTAAIEYARSLKAIRLSLATEITNETAQALYQSTGWKRDEQFYAYHFTL